MKGKNFLIISFIILIIFINGCNLNAPESATKNQVDVSVDDLLVSVNEEDQKLNQEEQQALATYNEAEPILDEISAIPENEI